MKSKLSIVLYASHRFTAAAYYASTSGPKYSPTTGVALGLSLNRGGLFGRATSPYSSSSGTNKKKKKTQWPTKKLPIAAAIGSNAAGIGRLFPEEMNIIFDSKCNICKLEINFLRNRDVKLHGKNSRKLRFTDLEGDDRLGSGGVEEVTTTGATTTSLYDPTLTQNGGVTYKVGMSSMHAVLSNGDVIHGPPVFHLAYEKVRLGWLFYITKLPLATKILDILYNIFAKYRTNVTRRKSIDELVMMYEQKRILEKQQQSCDDASNRCQQKN